MVSALRIVLLSPLLAVQAIWVILRATRLPEAAGARRGVIGQGPPLRVLVLGDSSAAGVGVAHQRDALGGQLAHALAADFTVSWDVIAKSGGTVASTCKLLRDMAPKSFDVVVVAVGVNDTKNGVRAAAWLEGYKHLIAMLRTSSPDAQLFLSGVPPLGAFPLLPAPLRNVLGARATHFDTLLGALADETGNATHVAFDLPVQPDKMARDGFHPGPEVYTYWANLIAARIRAG